MVNDGKVTETNIENENNIDIDGDEENINTNEETIKTIETPPEYVHAKISGEKKKTKTERVLGVTAVALVVAGVIVYNIVTNQFNDINAAKNNNGNNKKGEDLAANPLNPYVQVDTNETTDTIVETPEVMPEGFFRYELFDSGKKTTIINGFMFDESTNIKKIVIPEECTAIEIDTGRSEWLDALGLDESTNPYESPRLLREAYIEHFYKGVDVVFSGDNIERIEMPFFGDYFEAPDSCVSLWLSGEVGVVKLGKNTRDAENYAQSTEGVAYCYDLTNAEKIFEDQEWQYGVNLDSMLENTFMMEFKGEKKPGFTVKNANDAKFVAERINNYITAPAKYDSRGFLIDKSAAKNTLRGLYIEIQGGKRKPWMDYLNTHSAMEVTQDSTIRSRQEIQEMMDKYDEVFDQKKFLDNRLTSVDSVTQSAIIDGIEYRWYDLAREIDLPEPYIKIEIPTITGFVVGDKTEIEPLLDKLAKDFS